MLFEKERWTFRRSFFVLMLFCLLKDIEQEHFWQTLLKI